MTRRSIQEHLLKPLQELIEKGHQEAREHREWEAAHIAAIYANQLGKRPEDHPHLGTLEPQFSSQSHPMQSLDALHGKLDVLTEHVQRHGIEDEDKVLIVGTLGRMEGLISNMQQEQKRQVDKLVEYTEAVTRAVELATDAKFAKAKPAPSTSGDAADPTVPSSSPSSGDEGKPKRTRRTTRKKADDAK